MKRGQSRRLMLVLLAVTTVIVASVAAWGGFRGGTADAGAAVDGKAAGGSGILRIGTTSYIDSFNPWNYIEGQGLNAMIMVYPVLVQVDYSKQEGYYITGDWAKSWKASAGGKTWTFKLRPNTKWSDGRPMTADDAAWTINTTRQVRGRRDRGAGDIGQPRRRARRRRTRRRSSSATALRSGTRSGSSQGCPSCRDTSGSRTRRRRRAGRR